MDKRSAYHDQLKGNYNVVRGKLKQEYGHLTDDDLAYEDGKEDEFIGRVQKAIGKTKEEVVDWFERNF